MSYFELKPLSFRGKVTLVAPSGTFDKQLFNAGVTHLKLNKVKPSWDRNRIFEKHHYCAGYPLNRAEELVKAFKDKETEAIWAIRGGYGAIQLLPYLDEHIEEIKANPKLIIGFSDITVLHSYLVDKCGFVSIHGPNITTINKIDNYSKSRVIELLQGSDRAFTTFAKRGITVQPGSVKGIVKGGNITSIATLMGTPYEPDFDNSILFLEDINEPPYKIDRVLTQMRIAGKFKNIKGLILGNVSYREFRPPATKSVPYELILDAMGLDHITPVLAGFPAGHDEHNMAFLLGAVGTLDTEARTLSY